MDRWKYKCVGCGETLNVECNNCGHNFFKGRKIKKYGGYYLWLECVHCKHENDTMGHKCDSHFGGSYGEVIFKSAETNLEKNRDFFFKVGSEPKFKKVGSEPKFKSSFFPIMIFVVFLGFIAINLSQQQ